MVKYSKITKVFQLSLVIIFVLVLLGLFVPQQFQNISFYLKNLLTTSVGWFYLLLVTGILIFCVFLIVSPIGQIRLGNPTSRPEHSTTSWIAMMFSAGMGIGLVFYGAAEPLSHFAISTPNAEIGSADALADAFRFTFFTGDFMLGRSMPWWDCLWLILAFVNGRNISSQSSLSLFLENMRTDQ